MLTLQLGDKNKAKKPGLDFAPPPKSGIYKAKITSVNPKPVKSEQSVTMLRLGVSVSELVGGDEAQGFAEWMYFLIPPDASKEVNDKYKPDIQAWKIRNILVDGLGLGEAVDAQDAAGNAEMSIDPERWKGQEVFVDVTVYSEEYEGKKRDRARVEQFLSPEAAAEKAGLTDKESTSLEDAADAAAAAGDETIPQEQPSA